MGWKDRRSRLRGRTIAALTGGAVIAALASAVPPTAAEPVSNADTVYSTDLVTAAVGGVGDGTGTITVTGVSGSVTKASLYWHGIGDPVYDDDTVTVGGTPVTGDALGDATTNCWGAGASRAFRADVTSLVAGNGAYEISGLIGQAPSHQINGVSLFVFFDDGDETNDRDVVLFEGNDSNYLESFPGEDVGWHATLTGISYSGGAANLEIHVADGQLATDHDLTISGGGGSITIPDSTTLYDGNSVPSDGSSRLLPFGESSGLWDVHRFDITSTLSAGLNSLDLDSTDFTNDCLGLIVAAVDLPAGAAPVEVCGNGIDDDGDGQIDEDCTVEPSDTMTTYTGPSGGQYSDPVTLSGTLTDEGGAGIAGELLAFAVGTQSTSASPTDSTGGATASPLTLTQQPTTTTVETSFAGSDAFAASSDSDPFTITKEDCTLAYVGDTLVAPATQTRLAAQLGESDSSPGDWAGKTITFMLTDSAGVVTTYTATTDSTGFAETTQSIATNVYGVMVGFAGDDYYTACASPASPNDTILVVQAEGAAVTGGGWVSSSSRTSFGFNLLPPGSGWSGQLQVRVTNSKAQFHGNVVTGATKLSATSYRWTGTGKWKGTSGYTYEVTVVDNGQARKQTPDTIRIVIKSPAGSTVHDTGTLPLKGGNIQVH